MKQPTRLPARVCVILVALVLPLAAAASPATTATTTATASSAARAGSLTGGGARAAGGGWHRFHAQSFTAAAGTLCPFTVHSRVLFDREYVRTTKTFANGKPQTQQFVGPLVIRIVNKRSGRAVVSDISGRGVVEYTRNGSFDFRMQGPAAVGFHPGDSLRPGYYVLRGVHVVHFAADGTRNVVVDRGSEENLCSAVA